MKNNTMLIDYKTNIVKGFNLFQIEEIQHNPNQNPPRLTECKRPKTILAVSGKGGRSKLQVFH